MTRKGKSGFTLVELMVVLVIIGIFAAVTIPHLVEQRQRNVLTDFTNMIEQSAADTRILSMQTRRATVMEFSGDSVWINTLEGPNCWQDIAQRCVHNKGQTKDDSGKNVFDLKSDEYVHSKVFICDARAALVNADAETCDETVLTVGGSFAFCYSGRGELFVRQEADTGTPCDATGSLQNTDAADWDKACAQWDVGGDELDGGPGQASNYSGAMIRVNRFDDGVLGTCALGEEATGDIVGVTREIHIPAGGAPFGKVGI